MSEIGQNVLQAVITSNCSYNNKMWVVNSYEKL